MVRLFVKKHVHSKVTVTSCSSSRTEKRSSRNDSGVTFSTSSVLVQFAAVSWCKARGF